MKMKDKINTQHCKRIRATGRCICKCRTSLSCKSVGSTTLSPRDRKGTLNHREMCNSWEWRGTYHSCSTSLPLGKFRLLHGLRTSRSQSTKATDTNCSLNGTSLTLVCIAGSAESLETDPMRHKMSRKFAHWATSRTVQDLWPDIWISNLVAAVDHDTNIHSHPCRCDNAHCCRDRRGTADHSRIGCSNLVRYHMHHSCRRMQLSH